MPTALEDLLVDPETHERVRRATDVELAKINARIVEDAARRIGGHALPTQIDGAYLSHGDRWVYADVDGFASFLIEERIELDAPL